MGLAGWGAAVIAISVAAAAAWYDARTGRIPNALCLFAGIAGASLGAASGGLQGFGSAMAGGLVAALVPLLLYRAGAMGGGDVKLLFALGSLLGVQGGIELETIAFMAGAVHGAIKWARSGCLGAGARAVMRRLVPFGRRPATEQMRTASGTTIPFGPSILLGTVAQVVLAVAA